MELTIAISLSSTHTHKTFYYIKKCYFGKIKDYVQKPSKIDILKNDSIVLEYLNLMEIKNYARIHNRPILSNTLNGILIMTPPIITYVSFNRPIQNITQI